MELYETIFVTSNNDGIIGWYNTQIFNSYENAKEFINTCVKSNKTLNPTMEVVLVYGKDSKDNIHYIPLGYMGKPDAIFYGVRISEKDACNPDNKVYMDRYIIKHILPVK